MAKICCCKASGLCVAAVGDVMMVSVSLTESLSRSEHSGVKPIHPLQITLYRLC